MAKHISFLCPSSKGLSADLRLIKEHFFNNTDTEFCFFTANENLDIKEEAKAVKLKKVDFCENAKNIICAEISLPVRDMFGESEYSRVFIPGQYDYLFKRAITEVDEKRNTLSNFTNIIYPSPIVKSAIEKHYDLEGITAMDGYASPLAFDICQENKRNEIYNKVVRIYPNIAGKKIISILKNGKLSKECENALINFDLCQFLDQLSDDYIVLTNLTELLDKAHYLSDSQKSKFYFFDLLIPPSQLLYITDIAITNSSYLACTFASKRQPIYMLEYANSCFEQYMSIEKRKTFPNDSTEIAKEIINGGFDNSICETLSYPADNNIMNAIESVLK